VKIKVCLDTNALHENWLATGEAFTVLEDAIVKGGCAVVVSEVSVLEHVHHYERDAHQIEAKLKAQMGSYAKIMGGGYKAPQITALPDKQAFEKSFRSRLTTLGIKTLPIPTASHLEIIKRDLSGKKPFAPNGKGYRDTLTWLSVLESLDEATERLILVTQDVNDFANASKDSLHVDLVSEAKGKSPNIKTEWFPTPQKLADEVIKGLLKEIEEKNAEAAKTEKLLKRIQASKFKGFDLDQVVADGLENFEAQEPEGTFYAGSSALEEPLYVTSIESPASIEATGLYKLQNGNYLCEGTVEVRATVEGYLDKFEAFHTSQEGHAFVSDPNWNEHFSEVEVSNLPATATFSFEFEKSSGSIEKFEITKLTSDQDPYGVAEDE
jgi:hypothetical protein